MENTTNNPIVNTTSKRGRGRPHGSNCFANVPIQTILDFMAPSASIPVSKLWLKNTLGLVVDDAEVKIITNTGLRPLEENKEEEKPEKVQFAVHSFEE